MTDDKKPEQFKESVRKPLYDARGDNTKRIVKTLEWVDEMRIMQKWDLVLDGLDMVASMIQTYIEGYENVKKRIKKASREYEDITTFGYSSPERWMGCKNEIKTIYRELHEKARPFLLPDSDEDDSESLKADEFMEGSS